MRAYEGMFLVDEGRAAESFQEVSDHIRGLLERHGAKIEKLKIDRCHTATIADRYGNWNVAPLLRGKVG